MGMTLSLFADGLPLEAHLVHVDTTVASVGHEDVHVKLSRAQEVSLANLDHLAELGNTSPSGVKQLARERVEDEVNSNATSLSGDSLDKAVVSRVEDPVSRDAKGIHEVVDLDLAANCNVDLGSKHSCDLDGRNTYATTGTVDENRLE